MPSRTIAIWWRCRSLLLVGAPLAAMMLVHSARANAQSAQKDAVPYVRLGNIGPTLQWIVKAAGNRTVRPGQERLSAMATLERKGGEPVAVTIISEWPRKVRVVDDGTRRAIVFDGKRALSSDRITEEDQRLIDTLVEDTTDGMLARLIGGYPVDLIDEYVRIEGARKENPVTGLCHLYRVGAGMAVEGGPADGDRIYCFDSTTRLLKLVAYRQNGKVVETRYLSWMKIGSENVPERVQRLEDSQVMFTLSYRAVSLSAKGSDSLVEQP